MILIAKYLFPYNIKITFLIVAYNFTVRKSFLCILQQLEKRMGFLPGDCLIAAAFMSYMGPFLSEYRDQMVQKIWLAEVFT